MGRAPCCDKASVKKGPWSPEEDAKLKEYIEKHGTGGNWIALPQKVGLKRCGKSCRLRWLNYLRPNIKHGDFSDDEDRVICSLFATIGSRWSIIAAKLPGRTDNDIKNYWNTKLKKKLLANMASSSSQQQHKRPHPTSYQSAHSLLENTPIGFSYSPLQPQYSMANPSSFMQNSTSFTNYLANSTMLQVQDGYVDVMRSYQVEENFLVFGGEASSPDGSCITNNQISHGNNEYDHGENLGLQSFYNNGDDKFVMDKVETNNGFFALDYNSIEEIKQLISTNNNTCNNLNYFMDNNEIKSEEQVLINY